MMMMKTIPVEHLFALVDDEDYEYLSRFKWHLHIDRKNNRPYAYRSVYENKKNRRQPMHRDVMGQGFGSGVEVDHRDNEATLDNRKQNLRLATRSQNNCNRGMRRDNTSGIKGVSRDPRKPWLWKAQIMHHKKQYPLGSYATKEEAGKVYAEAAKRLHGEFARVA